MENQRSEGWNKNVKFGESWKFFLNEYVMWLESGLKMCHLGRVGNFFRVLAKM